MMPFDHCLTLPDHISRPAVRSLTLEDPASSREESAMLKRIRIRHVMPWVMIMLAVAVVAFN